MILFANPLFAGSNFLQALGWAVINSLWQMAFLWVIFQCVLSLVIQRPAAKSRLATIFLSGGTLWFFYTLLSHWLINPTATKTFVLALTGSSNGNSVVNQQLQQLLPYASAAYLLLLIFPTIQFIRNYRFVQLIRSSGLSKCNVDLRMFVQRFGERMGIRKPVRLYLSELITSPVTIGFLKPIILMPVAAINNLTQKQVEAVLLHELAHIRRYDYFINLFINFVRTILYFNPFVKSFAKTIERERERSCDEMVIQFEYDPHGYASALLVLERNNVVRQPIAVAASGQRKDLLHRIEKILGIEKRKSTDFRKLGGLLAGLMCVVALNALFFFSSPTLENQTGAFSAFSNPFYSLVSDGNEGAAVEKPIENKERQYQPAQLVLREQHRAKKETKNIRRDFPPAQHLVLSAPEVVNGYTLVDQKMHLEQILKKEEVAQVKNAVAATKKVLEQGQWKQVENSIADVMTENEKENLKDRYLKDVGKINWQKLEEKLKVSYNQINWNKVNAQLDLAITTITLDSLANVYNSNLADLSAAQNWMMQNKVDCIPDTDVKLGEVKFQSQQAEKALKMIKAIKTKKIIHL